MVDKKGRVRAKRPRAALCRQGPVRIPIPFLGEEGKEVDAKNGEN
jgi:hypothetical protein